MIPKEQVEEAIRHQVGGGPFCCKRRSRHLYLDVSLKRFETIYPACGSSNSAIELTIPELEKYSNFKQWIDVCKIIEDENK